NLRCAVRASRGQVAAVLGECKAVHPRLVPFERSLLLAGGNVPEFHGSVDASCGQQFTIWAERDSQDRTSVTVQSYSSGVPAPKILLAAGLCLRPQLSGLVVAPRGQQFAIDTERDGANAVRVSSQDIFCLSTVRVPELRCLVRAGGCQSFAVGTKRNG